MKAIFHIFTVTVFAVGALSLTTGCSYDAVVLGGPDPEQYVRTGHGPYGYSPPHVGLPQAAANPVAKGLVIVGANYGVGDRFIDVTEQVRTLAQGSDARIRVTKGNLLIDSANDPAPGERKALVVVYLTADGVEHIASAEDYDELIIGEPYLID